MNKENEDRFIEKDKAQPEKSRFEDGIYNTQTSKCPNCGSYNTYETTYVEGCNTCGWSFGY